MSDKNRLRRHPAKRFAAPEHLIDLQKAVEALRREPHKGMSGHRQKALYRHGPIECLVFLFEQGSHLADHVVNCGSVAIQVLEGSLSVKTSEAPYEMNAGSLLFLAPGVVHSVTGQQSCTMLLTISLDAPNTSPAE